jgi:16S rRNA (guanine966-N2)-methyltransferase
MRIVAGKWRGHNLFVPDIEDTRPTMDRTRQAVFNILRSASWALKPDGTPLLQNAFVLDVFAGSGAMGFEALSQGATQATFFEQHPEAGKTIEKNEQKMRATGMIKIIRGDVMKLGLHSGAPAQMAFFDPPYHQSLLEPSLVTMKEKNWINNETLLVMEMHKQENPAIELTIHDSRIYGTSKVIFANLV